MRLGWLAVTAVLACAAAAAHAQGRWAYCQIERVRCVATADGCDNVRYVWDAPHFFVAPFVTHDRDWNSPVDAGAEQALRSLVIQRTGLHDNYSLRGVQEYWHARCPKNDRVVIENWAKASRRPSYIEVGAGEIGR